MVHEIRLAGPWEFSADGFDWTRCVLPLTSEVVSETNEILLRRKFHRSSGLTDITRVLIVVLGNSIPNSAQVNGHGLTPAPDTAPGGVAYDLTEHLQDFNTFEVAVLQDARSRAAIIESVKLRIVDDNSQSV